MNDIKKIDIKEFREKGYLQEVNRLFFHPLGLALEVTIDEDSEETISGVWDYRDDPEGMYYDLENSEKDRIEKFRKNASYVRKERLKFSDTRVKKFGWVIEPLYTDEGEEL